MLAAWLLLSCPLLMWEVPWTVSASSMESTCCMKKIHNGVVYTFLGRDPAALDINCKDECTYGSQDSQDFNCTYI